MRTLDTDAGTASVRFSDTLFGNDIHAYYNAAGVFEYDRTTGELNRSPDETGIRIASTHTIGCDNPWCLST
ncbi:hypothetical protein [Halonotius sp. F2-221B]|uniref:hypothetical protein n=1 Tax=Halonotius sp. F2-221B TaxID=2731620 RepID=UPI00398A8C8A